MKSNHKYPGVCSKMGTGIAALFIFSCETTTEKFEVSADHHVHLRSEEATDALVEIQEAIGEQVIEGTYSSTTASDIIVRMDTAGVGKASLLSVAYFFGMPEVDFESEQEKVRNENQYTALQASEYPDRLVAFCSFNPLSEYSIEELTYCGDSGDFTGVKLHLANSDVDLRDEGHQQKLSEIFETANEYGLAIVIHLWTRNPDYGYEDAELFITEIIPSAPEVTIQIAHLGGPSGYTDATDGASGAFLDAFEAHHEGFTNVYFDLAEVMIHPNRADGNEELENMIQESNNNAEKRIEQLGVHRVLIASDWIADTSDEYRKSMRDLPLSDELIHELRENTAPYFD